MHLKSLVAAAAALATAEAQYIGFNYASTFTDGSAKQQSDFEAEFNRAKSLQGTNGAFTSARLYTMIQGSTTDTPISAIPAAINTKTTLLLGLWASAGQDDFDNEMTALKSAINQYGTSFTDLIAGISVGSEDLYRNSPTGIKANGYNAGANPDVIVSYINQVKMNISGTAASGASVGHVDTWTAWVNGTNDAVITACDWLGMDAYPYFQNTMDNSIELANSTFYDAYDNTVAVAQGKDVWVTETGWPVSGPTENEAVASVDNAETYWQDVYCSLAGHINTWWYILQDAEPTTPSPSFGIIGSDLSSAPLYNLTCSNGKAPSSSATSSATTSAATSAGSATKPASSAGPNTESLSNATPGPQTSPSSASIHQTTHASSVATTAASQSPSKASGSAKSSAAVTSSAASHGAASSTVSAMTSTSTTVVGGKTHTVYQTTMVTITSCPDDCTSTASGSSAPAPTSYASHQTGSVGTAAPSPASSSATTPAAPEGTHCPANLGGEYQYPHLIVPVNKDEPNTAYGTQYNATLSPSISTIFDFDLPASYAGKTCSLVFLFPKQAALETSAFTFNGQGGISVNELSSPATAQTTYANMPSAAVAGIGSIASVQPGNSYVVASHECNAGARQSFEFMSTGGLDLEYFQDYNPSPIGAYITVC